MECVLRRLRGTRAQLIDIGANIGAFTLAAAADGHAVQAFEPMPTNAWMLHESLRRNGLERLVKLHRVGLGAVPGSGVALSPPGRGPGNQGGWRIVPSRQVPAAKTYSSEPISSMSRSASVSLPASSPAAEGWTVPIVTLDALPPLAGPILVKLDIEGSECAALQGGMGFINRSDVRGLWMEWWQAKPRCCSTLQATLFAVLQSRGMLPYSGPCPWTKSKQLVASRLCEHRYGPRRFRNEPLVWM